MCDLVRRTRIFDTGREPVSNTKTLLDLAQKQQATVG